LSSRSRRWRRAAAEIKTKVDEQVDASSEVAQVVAALERQYDAFIAAQENRSLLTRDEDLLAATNSARSSSDFLAQQAEKKFDDVRSGLSVLTGARQRSWRI